MNISKFGEFNLINHLMEVISKDNLDIINNLSELGYVLSVPSGDDSAVWNSLDNSHVVTVDALVDKVHFNLDYIDLIDPFPNFMNFSKNFLTIADEKAHNVNKWALPLIILAPIFPFHINLEILRCKHK